MLRVGLIGLGKMGISHLAIIKSHPEINLVAVCDPMPYVPDLLAKYTGIKIHSDYREMFRTEELDAVFIATPSRFHGEMVRAALDKNLHVFCEKPFCLDPGEGAQLAALAQEKQLVNQVGYHFRFVGAFQEAKRQIEAGALGKIHHVRAEAYGPVVLRPKGSTWRTNKNEGGGCLYDYACHAIDIMHFLVGPPESVAGTVLNKVFSRDVEDEVYSTFYFADGSSGQVAANWSDESFRKMSTRLTLWGTNGRITVDRQEIQTYVRDTTDLPPSLDKGWNIRYTTELTEDVQFYLRGEEYSAQVDHFVDCITKRCSDNLSSFTSAVQTDKVAAMMLTDVLDRRVTVPVTMPNRYKAKKPMVVGHFFKTIRDSIR